MAGNLGLGATVLVLLIGSLASAQTWDSANAQEGRLEKLAYRQFVIAQGLQAPLTEAQEVRLEKRTFVAHLAAQRRSRVAWSEAEEMRQVKQDYHRFLDSRGGNEAFAEAP